MVCEHFAFKWVSTRPHFTWLLLLLLLSCCSLLQQQQSCEEFFSSQQKKNNNNNTNFVVCCCPLFLLLFFNCHAERLLIVILKEIALYLSSFATSSGVNLDHVHHIANTELPDTSQGIRSVSSAVVEWVLPIPL